MKASPPSLAGPDLRDYMRDGLWEALVVAAGGRGPARRDATAATQLRALLAAWARLDDRVRLALLQTAEALVQR